MKIGQMYSSNGGLKVIMDEPDILNEITLSLTNPLVKFEKGDPPFIKLKVSNTLSEFGWGDEVKLEPTNLTINFMKKRVGFCLQLGNVARTYADLLKIQSFYERNIIDVGVIAVPDNINSRKMGSNLAQYERLEEEIKLFGNFINAPIVLIGLVI